MRCRDQASEVRLEVDLAYEAMVEELGLCQTKNWMNYGFWFCRKCNDRRLFEKIDELTETANPGSAPEATL